MFAVSNYKKIIYVLVSREEICVDYFPAVSLFGRCPIRDGSDSAPV